MNILIVLQTCGSFNKLQFYSGRIKSKLKSGNACYHSMHDPCLPIYYPKI